MTEDHPSHPAKSSASHYFITGFPDFLAQGMVKQILSVSPEARITLLIPPDLLPQAKPRLESLQGQRLEVLTGDIIDMHLGLSGDEYIRMCASVTDIFHIGGISDLSVRREMIWRANVEGTRNLIELARDCACLNRLNYYSTCYMSGDRIGVIAEDELDLGQGFRNPYEETKFHAEKLLQRVNGLLPISIYRPSSVVGDSQTGEIDRFEGPYYLGILLVMSPLMVALPLPGDGAAPLNVVPVDFVTRSIWALSRDSRAVGRTFHLVDPNPMSARRAYEIIAEKEKKRLPRFSVSAKAAEVMLRLPILEKLSRPHRAAISYVNHLAIYNCHNTLELLDGTGIRCPPLTSYLDKLIAYVQEQYRRRREEHAEVEDPLDQAPADPDLSVHHDP
jgi:thioester reductase-like protein